MHVSISGDIPSESSPEIIAPFDFKMNDAAYRQAFLKHLLGKRYTKVDTYDGLPIYMTGIANHKGYLFATDGKELFYFVKFITLKLRGLRTKVNSTVQVAIWRNDNAPQTADLSQHMFDTILLPRFGIMTSDGQQTAKGKRFWLLRMRQAMKMHRYVYLYNRMTNALTNIQSMDDLTSALQTGYGVGKKFRDYRFIISLTPIVGRD